MNNTQESKENQKGKKEHSNTKWFIEVFIMTFILSMIFSYNKTHRQRTLLHFTFSGLS